MEAVHSSEMLVSFSLHCSNAWQHVRSTALLVVTTTWPWMCCALCCQRGYAKVCVHWMSRRLINAHNEAWKTTVTSLLCCYDTAQAVLSHTYGDHWVYGLSPSFWTKVQESINWLAPHKYSRAKEIQQSTIRRKSQPQFLQDKGLTCVGFLLSGTTANLGHYLDTSRKLKHKSWQIHHTR
jgi:hypothetical protein